ncbi:hypothetical protein Drorol1_Dr00004882 [Drosera rotundifolia]
MDRIISRTRTCIWLIAMVVCLVYLMTWIMMPTTIYQTSWLLVMVAKFSSTYFGSDLQGYNLLVYMFPVLFVAVAGCIYLHLGKKLSRDGHTSEVGKMRHFGGWRQPVLVRGPLGMVSGIELGFFIMFIGLLVWSFSNYLRAGFSQITPAQVQQNDGKLWVARLDAASQKLGLVGNICLAFLFFPVTRASSILPLFGLTSDASIKYHIWLGHLVMLLFTAHGLCCFIFWHVTKSLSQMLKWQHVGIANVPGELSLLTGLCIWATTYPRVRRKFFELFFYTHYLYIVFILLFILHVGISNACNMLPGFFLFMIDRYLRFLQSRRHVSLASARILLCEALELNFAKTPGLTYCPTSILFVNVPSISKLQWHPFTVVSSSGLEHDRLSVVIKVEGTWTRKLYEKLASSPTDHLEVSVEGPYGPASTQFLRHDTIVMVCGGSGITPFLSIIRELIYMKTVLQRDTPKLLLVSAFKKSSDLSILDLILPLSASSLDITDMDLQIEAYVTREKGPPAAGENTKESQETRTLWFKQSPSDMPISLILGQNGWLWLAAIISSSFIGFLLFMGILTRYYIYPIDHNTNEIFSSATRTMLNLLLICICIVVSASVAVLWNKNRNAMETNQIADAEDMSPRASPQLSSWVNDDGKDPESQPHQRLAHCTNIHYGKRPDLKRILFDCKGPSTGVLVAGPKRIRQEVAAICSSSLTDNLHCQSISFSW